jgi:hypothetical protein
LNTDEKRARDFLIRNGFEVKEFTKEEKSKSKTPDFKVFKGRKLVFFCEVKTIDKDAWIEELKLKAPSNGKIFSERGDPKYNCISNKIYEAVKQFDAVNADQKYPNVLIFINYNDNCRLFDLECVLVGSLSNKSGRKIPFFKAYSNGKIKLKKLHVHLYLWIDEVKNVYWRFIFDNKKNLDNLCTCFNIKPSQIPERKL